MPGLLPACRVVPSEPHGRSLHPRAFTPRRPAPTDVDAIGGTLLDGETRTSRPSSDDEPMSALAFKIMTDPFVGSLTFARMYSGVLNKVTL